MVKTAEKKKAFGFMKSSFLSRSKRQSGERDAKAKKDKQTTEAEEALEEARHDETGNHTDGTTNNSEEGDPRVTTLINESINPDEEEEAVQTTNQFFESISSNFLSIVKGATAKSASDEEAAVGDIVASVRDRIDQGDTEESASLQEILRMMNQYKEKIGEVGKKYVGNLNLRKLSPTAVMYYLEREDEIKNPSWKRRKNRFCPKVKIDKIHELNDYLDLANLCYADTADEIEKSLDKDFKTSYHAVYVNVKSTPGKPANFVAVKRDQTSNSAYKTTSSSLKVIIGVRGTKTPADAITDLLCETADYKGGKAHSMITESGRYIALKHRGLLEELRVKAGKKKVKLTLIGHSLGAGAASIAGMEMNDLHDPTLEVKVIGFGCPALVSQDLAMASTEYITTVVNDDDVVPRMSGVAVANLLVQIMSFDWLLYAQRDIRGTLTELQNRHSRIFRETTAKKILQTVEPLLEKRLQATLLKDRPEPLELEVYPPGKCIHLYRDGSGISSSYVPNTFFDEILVSRRMIDDHLFHSGYQKAFLEIARQAEKDHHFRFDG